MQLIILDRDGVINYDSPDYIKNPDEWQAIPGSLEAIMRLNQAGFKVAVATNQSGIARGYYDLAMLKQIHHKMFTELAAAGGHIDVVVFCPHHPNDHCDCRKPKPGLLHQISQQLHIPLTDALMIGDSARDIEAAHAAGAQAFFIGEHDAVTTMVQVPVFNNLAAAVNAILQSYG